jgi:aromatic ring-opening dioxygenase catalytic subunit (LigB family)
MTKADLEKLGRQVSFEEYDEKDNQLTFQYGFLAALELMWPCVEALHVVNVSAEYDLSNKGHKAVASAALKELEANVGKSVSF